MGKILHNKVIICIVVLTIWTGILIIMCAIPELISALRVANSVKYEIMAGYADEYFMQGDIIYGVSYSIFFVFFLILNFIFSIISLFKIKMIKIIGKTVITQNIIFLSLQVWKRFFTNGIDEVYIDIKWYLCFVIIFAIVLTFLSFEKHFFYLMMIIVFILQGIDLILFLTKYSNNLLDIGFSNIIFYGSNFVTIILYWLLILAQHKHNKQQNTISN